MRRGRGGGGGGRERSLALGDYPTVLLQCVACTPAVQLCGGGDPKHHFPGGDSASPYGFAFRMPDRRAKKWRFRAVRSPGHHKEGRPASTPPAARLSVPTGCVPAPSRAAAPPQQPAAAASSRAAASKRLASSCSTYDGRPQRILRNAMPWSL